jgi:hypothetical protein
MKNYLLRNALTIVVSLIYLTLILFFTYPLILNLTTHIPGDGGDSFIFLWNQWWIKHSLVNWQNPYFTDFIGYPLKTNLVFHTLTFTTGLLSLPLQIFLPPVLVFNLLLILSLLAASLGMYSLLYYFFKNPYLAFCGGVFFTLNAYLFQEMQGHFQYTSIYFIPWFIYFFIKIFTENKINNSFVAAIILAMSLYNEFYYAIGLIISGLLITAGFWLSNKKIILARLKSLVIFLSGWILISLPLLYLSIKTALAKDYPLANLAQINLYTPDLRSFLVPSQLHQFFGQYFQNYYYSLGYHQSTVFLGFGLIIFSIMGYLFYKKDQTVLSNKFWLLFAIVFMFLALGPFVYLDGYIFNWDGVGFTLPLPYLLFYFIPFVKGILVPPRFIIFVFFGLIVLSGFFLEKLFNRFDKPAYKFVLAGLVLTLFFAENIYLPLTLVSADIPNFYKKLAQEKEDYTILELPFAFSTSYYTVGTIPVSSITEYYQSVHQKKIINGWISRAPNSYYDFFSGLSGLTYLTAPQTKKIDNPEQAKANFSKLKIKYIIIHPEYYNHENLTNTTDYLYKIYKQKPVLTENLLIYKL